MTDNRGVRWWGIGASFAGTAAAAAAVVGMGVASADDSTVDFNGWSVDVGQPVAPGAGTLSATLLDPSNSLGFGDEVPGTFSSGPEVISSHFNELFGASASSPSVDIQDNWFAGLFEIVSNVTAANNGLDEAQGIFVPAVGGKEVVDVFNWGPSSDPLINPDATGPVNVGGLDLASPQDGALLNDVFDAVFNGDAADWGKAATLFDDLLGIDASGTADAVDPGSLIG